MENYTYADFPFIKNQEYIVPVVNDAQEVGTFSHLIYNDTQVNGYQIIHRFRMGYSTLLPHPRSFGGEFTIITNYVKRPGPWAFLVEDERWVTPEQATRANGEPVSIAQIIANPAAPPKEPITFQVEGGDTITVVHQFHAQPPMEGEYIYFNVISTTPPDLLGSLKEIKLSNYYLQPSPWVIKAEGIHRMNDRMFRVTGLPSNRINVQMNRERERRAAYSNSMPPDVAASTMGSYFPQELVQGPLPPGQGIVTRRLMAQAGQAADAGQAAAQDPTRRVRPRLDEVEGGKRKKTRRRRNRKRRWFKM